MNRVLKPMAAIIGAAICVAAAAPFAINNSVRPPEDVARDASRNPSAMVAFAKIKAGQTVVDILPGGGYFTRIFAQVVGPNGKVVALVSDQMAARQPETAAVIQALASEPAYANFEPAVRSLGNIGAPNSIDMVWTAQNYHDLRSAKLPPNTITGINRAVFAALKPGGIVVVVDHSAAKGSGARDVDTLHRIDGALVIAEVTSVGFEFAEESSVFANPADDHSKIVFDPAIRGNTDQFVYRFVKPKM